MTPSTTTLSFPARIGLGTWKIGATAAERERELAAVQHAMQIGYRLFDTAEMYADGGAERILGAALKRFGAARRSELFIVSKVLPDNGSRAGCVRACEASLQRLGCEYLDLYLLHWRGAHPFIETLRGFETLLQRGLIRQWGVSNFDVQDLQQWREAESRLGARRTQCNQVYYCAEARHIEYDLLPWQRAHGIQTMAYSPLGRGALARHPTLVRIAEQRGTSAAEVALAWSIREPEVVAIPKSSDLQRIEHNLRAAQLQLTAAELAQIDAAFPPPRSKRPLAMI